MIRSFCIVLTLSVDDRPPRGATQIVFFRAMSG
jgi:hypothetical protein